MGILNHYNGDLLFLFFSFTLQPSYSAYERERLEPSIEREPICFQFVAGIVLAAQ